MRRTSSGCWTGWAARRGTCPVCVVPWLKQSYPFYHNERIVTPTLFMVGDKDFNVPSLNSEQMYQALRSRGVDTGLIVYPAQFHGLKRPSFLKDRIERWLTWYDAHGSGLTPIHGTTCNQR